MRMLQVDRVLMIDFIFMPAIISLLLQLICLMAVHCRVIQILDDIAEIFVDTRFGFGHRCPSLLKSDASNREGLGRTREFGGCNPAPYSE